MKEGKREGSFTVCVVTHSLQQPTPL